MWSLKECSKVFNRLGFKVPKALVLVQLLIPFITWSVVNVSVDVNDFRLISLNTIRASREEVCLPSFCVGNCLLKQLAICFGKYT